MKISLNSIEQRLAICLAKERHNQNRKSGASNCKIGPQSDEITDLEGIAAEIAFCKLLNVYPDTDIEHHPSSDAILPNGKTVDIKATIRKNGRLLAVRWKKPDVDLYALIVGKFPEYVLVGTATSEELLNDDKLKDLGHGLTYCMEQSELNKSAT